MRIRCMIPLRMNTKYCNIVVVWPCVHVSGKVYRGGYIYIKPSTFIANATTSPPSSHPIHIFKLHPNDYMHINPLTFTSTLSHSHQTQQRSRQTHILFTTKPPYSITA